jgi:hypothetical protein
MNGTIPLSRRTRPFIPSRRQAAGCVTSYERSRPGADGGPPVWSYSVFRYTGLGL